MSFLLDFHSSREQKCLQQFLLVKHHKNCTMEISRRARKRPIRKKIIIRAVLVTAMVRESAAKVVTSVPMVPAIRPLLYAQKHRCRFGTSFEPENGARAKSASRETIEMPKAIQRATVAFAIMPRLNITATPMPAMTLTTNAVMLLQEFWLHIFIILSF